MSENKIEHEFFTDGYLRYEHLIGLQFEHGVRDCYTMLQKMFEDNTPIRLAPYARPDDWWISGMDLYSQNYRNEGFERIEEKLRADYNPLDVFLISIPDSRNMDVSVANHCAIYLGNGMMIHHRLGKLSEVRPYRHAMKDYTTAIIRHKDVPELIKSKGSSVDIMEHILPHKRDRILGALNDRKNKDC